MNMAKDSWGSSSHRLGYSVQMTSEFQIRTYRACDRGAVWRLHNEALDDVGAHAGNGPWDNDLHHIDDVYFGAGGEFLVGTLDCQIVAMGALRPTAPGRGEIRRMRTLPGFQGRGLGTALYHELERRALVQGFSVLHLDTTTGQRAAQRLYEREGFREVGRGQLGRFKCIYYEKRISQ